MPKPSEPDLETARRIMKRLTEMPHREHKDSKLGQPRNKRSTIRQTKSPSSRRDK